LGEKTYALTIRDILEVEMHPRPGVVEYNPVLYFEETRKGLILTAHNRAMLAELFGDAIDDCIGTKVKLRAEMMNVAGRKTFPVRIVGGEAPPAATADPFESNAEADAAIAKAESGMASSETDDEF
jgi:F0F1-type ATP synthase alpha subunit